MRKAFKFIDPKKVVTSVYDCRSAFVPDQSLSLRELMTQFGFLGAERMSEIINRGFDGDEDDDLLGVDVGALDYSEVHDRMLELMSSQKTTRAVHAEVEDVEAPASRVEDPEAPAAHIAASPSE